MITLPKMRYLIIPDEISVEQKIVQAAHVAACIQPHDKESSIHLVLVSVPTKIDLLTAALELKTNKILYHIYYDIEYHGKLPTAILTDWVVKGSHEQVFLAEKFTLYRFNR